MRCKKDQESNADYHTVANHYLGRVCLFSGAFQVVVRPTSAPLRYVYIMLKGVCAEIWIESEILI
jgi:hypothetical protein